MGHEWHIVEGDGPHQKHSPRGKYDALWDDLLLRLEVTPANKSVDVLLDDKKRAHAVWVGLVRRAREMGDDVVSVCREGTRVIVQRGKNWKTRGAGSLAHIQAHPDDALGLNEENRARYAANGHGKRPRNVSE